VSRSTFTCSSSTRSILACEVTGLLYAPWACRPRRRLSLLVTELMDKHGQRGRADSHRRALHPVIELKLAGRPRTKAPNPATRSLIVRETRNLRRPGRSPSYLRTRRSHRRCGGADRDAAGRGLRAGELPTRHLIREEGSWRPHGGRGTRSASHFWARRSTCVSGQVAHP
jgi:hypothetical protein